jgi:hypothetical protein
MTVETRFLADAFMNPVTEVTLKPLRGAIGRQPMLRLALAWPSERFRTVSTLS